MFKKNIGRKGINLFSTKAAVYTKDKTKLQNLLGQSTKKLKNHNGIVSSLVEKVQLLIEVVKAWKSGEYRTISTKSILMIIAGLLYFVTPLDLIPDFIIGLGIVDDAAVIGFVINQLNKELDQFKNWKTQKKEDLPIEIKDYD
jgi:uncharacterized membrane protein YkvA (DUF1232 family)